MAPRAGATRMTLMLPAGEYLALLSELGLGRATDIGTAQENPGALPTGEDTVAHTRLGLAGPKSGILVNLTQLTQAYIALAGDGFARRAYMNSYQRS